MQAVRGNDPTKAMRLPVSRRSLLLRGGALVGLSMLGTAGLGSTAAMAAPRIKSPKLEGHLVLDYQPSEPTGWPAWQGQTVGMSLGGHVPSKDFTDHGTAYQIRVLPFDQPGDAVHPVYEGVPSDPTINYRNTLDDTFGDYYSFRYVGGLPGRNEFRIRSYGVTATEGSDTAPTDFGGGIYLIYEPDASRGDPGIHDDLFWIQCGSFLPNRGSSVDSSERANPFYHIGGLTSINGRDVFNFNDLSRTQNGNGGDLSTQYIGETFLAQDTGVKDSAGKEIVNIFGGIKWGWEVKRA